MMQVNTWGLSQYNFGHEIRIDVTDDDGRIFNESYGFDHSPTEQEISDAVQVVLDRLELRKQMELEVKPVEEIV